MNTKFYGNSKEEEKLSQAIASREIVKEILDFGINQYQLAKIIYLLSLELEDRNVLSEVSAAIKPLLSEENDKNSTNVILT